MGWEWTRLWKVLLPHKLFGACRHLGRILREYPRDRRVLGANAASMLLRLDLEHWLRRIFQRHHLDQAPRDLVPIRMLGYRDPIFIRRNTSDRFIVRQVFRDDEYGSVDLAGPIHRFVDAGANIGCATYYLLHRYPDAVAEVIEPDADNLAVCQRNLAVFGERVHLHGKGVWPRTAPLRVVRPPTGTAMESTIRVVECLPGEKPDVEGVSLDDLARQGDRSPFDLVKMDIEGAETPILEASPRWLDSTRNLMIELHGPEAHRVFQQVIKRYRAERIATVGDVTVCTGLHRREGTPVGTG